MTQTERGTERTQPAAARQEWARLDPITFEVLKNSVDAIVDEMALTTLRTAFSPSTLGRFIELIEDSYQPIYSDSPTVTLASLKLPYHKVLVLPGS